jgi:hypothetical protein
MKRQLIAKYCKPEQRFGKKIPENLIFMIGERLLRVPIFKKT